MAGGREPRGEAHEEHRHLVGRQRVEREVREAAQARAPGRPALEEVGAREGHDEDGPGARAVGDRLDEVEERGVGPLELLEDEDDGPALGDPLEEGPAGRLELLALAGRRGLEAEQGRQARLHPGPLRRVGDVVAEGRRQLLPRRGGVVALGDAGALADHLAERPERQPLAVGGRAAAMPVDVGGDAVDVLLELPGEAGLADPGDPDDGGQAGAPVAGGGVEEVLEQLELLVAADERRLDAAAAARPAAPGDDADRPPRRHGRRLAAEQLLAGGLEDDRVARRAVGRLPDEHHAGRSGRLETRRGVDEVAGDHALPRGADDGGRLARQDRGARLRPLGSEAGHGRDEVERRADGALGVVLADRRRAPDRHDGVADELLDRAAVALDDLAGELEVAAQELADGLRVGVVGERW